LEHATAHLDVLTAGPGGHRTGGARAARAFRV